MCHGSACRILLGSRSWMCQCQRSWWTCVEPVAYRRHDSTGGRHLPVRSLRNLTGSHLEPGRDSCAHRSNRRARVDQEGRSSPCLRLARLRHGHACCKHETRRVRLTLPENANSCSCASSTCALASESHRIACGTRTRQLCACFQKSRVSPCFRLARVRHGHTCCKHEEKRHVDTDCL